MSPTVEDSAEWAESTEANPEDASPELLRSAQRHSVGSPASTQRFRAIVAGKRGATLFSVGMLAVMLSPIRQNWSARKSDSFPLSYYPMFSQSREHFKAAYLVGIDGHGERTILPYTFASSGGGFNQTRHQIRRVSADEAQAHELCEAIAAKIALDPLYKEVMTVYLVTGYYEFDKYFKGDTAPAREVINASARVSRVE